MSLSDIVSGSGFHQWSEIGLIISFSAFIALLIWLFVIRKGRSFEHESRLPLEDTPARPTSDPAGSAASKPTTTEEVEES